MNRVVSADIRTIQPRLSKTPSGWLAVSERGSVLRIGVEGNTKEEARRRFQAELEEWAKLSEQAA
jgi:hypothetical protein